MLSRLAVTAARVLAAGMDRLPPAAWGASATVLVPLAWWSLPSYRRRTLRNLEQSGFAKHRARSLARCCFRSNLLVLFEALAMDRLLARRGVTVKTTVTPAAAETFRRIRAGEVPVTVAVTGHTGVWEFLGAELARTCAPVETLVTVQLTGNPVLDRFLQDLRGRHGLHPVPKEKILRAVFDKVRRGEPCVAAFLCDLHFKGGPKVPFLGRRACTVPVPAELVVRHHAPMLHGYCLREKPGAYRILMDCTPPPLRSEGKGKDPRAVERVMASINRSIERAVSLAPEQWIWTHKRWKSCCGANEITTLDTWKSNGGGETGTPP